jgi:hypothetical protein
MPSMGLNMAMDSVHVVPPHLRGQGHSCCVSSPHGARASPPHHNPLNGVTSRRGHGQIPSLPPPWPPHGLMRRGRVYGSPTPRQAAPRSTHLLAFWLYTGPVQQKGCGCECSWSRERGRRRLVSAVGAAQQQHPPIAEGLENGLATREEREGEAKT